MDDDGHSRSGIVNRLGSAALRLLGPGASHHDRSHELEVARVVGQHHRHGLATLRLVGALGAVVVLHVSGTTLGRERTDVV